MQNWQNGQKSLFEVRFGFLDGLIGGFGDGLDIVDVWRDQCDRRSRKFFCQLRKFLEKQRKMLYNLTPNDLINA